MKNVNHIKRKFPAIFESPWDWHKQILQIKREDQQCIISHRHQFFYQQHLWTYTLNPINVAWNRRFISRYNSLIHNTTYFCMAQHCILNATELWLYSQKTPDTAEKNDPKMSVFHKNTVNIFFSVLFITACIIRTTIPMAWSSTPSNFNSAVQFDLSNILPRYINSSRSWGIRGRCSIIHGAVHVDVRYGTVCLFWCNLLAVLGTALILYRSVMAYTDGSPGSTDVFTAFMAKLPYFITSTHLQPVLNPSRFLSYWRISNFPLIWHREFYIGFTLLVLRPEYSGTSRPIVSLHKFIASLGYLG